eukprot:CAMPEP_0116125332 /NCGR_PEP_ID=MMETSP0329-20121206/5755_1 /TAXON_ID=697910 /ORGANISM="Pseudo-nitzschia arenysensis, Strain B593" /LENGTH=679 /DNA_ID=CAMNT_0003619367 /DNA_START=130 /DNA_END=2169 /DNA_ORIENTATION=+
MAVVTTNNDDSVSQRQAQALVTLLETFHPRSALKPHLVQLKAIVKDLELEDGLPDAVLTCPTSTSTECDKSQQDGPEEDIQKKLTVDTEILSECDVDTKENAKDEDDVADLITKLKGSLSFSPQHSVGSTTALRNDEGAVNEPSVATESFHGGSMKTRTFNMAALTLNKHPSNEILSPSNKPPTPMKSSSVRSPKEQQPKGSAPQSQSPSRCGDRYRNSSRFIDASVQQEVFETSSILARILQFDGSLAAYHKNYDLIEGYKTPFRRRRNQSRFQRRPGTNELAFVNRKFHSLILGPEGLEEWKTQAKQEIESCKRIARQLTSSNSADKPSALAKIFAIVIRNDAIEFEYLLSKYVTLVQQGTYTTNDDESDIFGMALKEYVDGECMEGGICVQDGIEGFEASTSETRSMGLPRGHPFLNFIKCWQANEFYYTTLLAELAYNAIVFGAHDVLKVLSSRHNSLFSIAFDSTGQNLLGGVVAYACSQPGCLQEVSQGIRALMAHQRYSQDDLHTSQKGSHGNALHLAAAKGDRDLVDALLDIGFDPTQRCDERALPSGTNEKLWYAEDWARIRGHKRVVRLLARRRKQILQQMDETSAGNTTADYQTVDYETITANDTLTADYGSSSCSSDYDSDYDSLTTGGNTFGEGNTYGDESSEYDSEDESRIRYASSYLSMPIGRR